MTHVTLTRCLASLGLTACAVTPASIQPELPPGPEPSGLDTTVPASGQTTESGPRFVSEGDQWCSVLIDARGRTLEPTQSFLEAWNLVAANGQRATRYVSAPPHTEDDARVRICGRVDCTIEQPQVFQATTVPNKLGPGLAGFGVLLPSERGRLVVPIAGTGGECVTAPELRIEQVGSLMHVTALVHEGRYARTYYHHGGYEGGEYGHGGPVYGGCETLATARTDIVVDVSTGELELVLTQAPPRDLATTPLVEATLAGRGIQLQGCADVLELVWTT
jgi:hypothetical protein